MHHGYSSPQHFHGMITPATQIHFLHLLPPAATQVITPSTKLESQCNISV
jgi:hypothetical protein